MQPPLEAALEAVALRLSAARVPFLLGGSALLDALGLDVTVRDIDLMLRPEDREAFEAACADWLVATTTEPGEILSSDWKATLDVGGVEVEGLGLSVAESHANFVWFDVGENEPAIVKDLAQRGVLVRAGGALGRPGALRVTVGTQAENERFIEALGDLL